MRRPPLEKKRQRLGISAFEDVFANTVLEQLSVPRAQDGGLAALNK